MDSVPVEPRVHCVLLPCSSGQVWAVPLNSIAEVVTSAELLSGQLRWRGLELSVYPPAAVQQPGAIYAVMLGLGELAGEYWAIQLQNRRLEYLLLSEADCAGQAENGEIPPESLAELVLGDAICEVPDLEALQKSLATVVPGSVR
jgi:hypothetical protein